MAHPTGRADWRIGCIGFAYPDWRGAFFPPGLPEADRLAAYGRAFESVELDTTFYATPTRERFAAWARAVGPGFRFALKAPRAVTHGEGRHHLGSAGARDGLSAFIESASALGRRLGCVLLQFPPSRTVAEADGLARLLGCDHGVPLAVEFRHPSWCDPAIEALLRGRSVAWVGADLAPIGDAATAPGGFDDGRSKGRYRPLPWMDTAPFVYLRWNGRHGQYPRDDVESVDATPRLAWWLDRLRDALFPGRLVYGFCGNSFAGFGPGTCRRLQALLGRPCWSPPQGSLFDGAGAP